MATGWSTAAKNDAVDAVAKNSGAVWVAAYTDAACTTEVAGGAYTRKEIEGGFPDAEDGAVESPVVVLDIPANTTVRGLARHTTPSGGSPYDARALVVAEPFGSAGKLEVVCNIFVEEES